MADPHAQAAAQTGTVVLKKYGNRRLYDTSASKYVTLQDLEEMVQRGTDVQVLDAKSGEDLTKEVLVQIILDKDGAREMLPIGFLKQVVRLSSSPTKETFTRTLQDALDAFSAGQRAVVDAQRSFLAQFTQPPAWNPFNPFPPPQPQYAPPPPAAGTNVEVERLRAEVSETQALLRELLSAKNEKGEKKAKKKR